MYKSVGERLDAPADPRHNGKTFEHLSPCSKRLIDRDLCNTAITTSVTHHPPLPRRSNHDTDRTHQGTPRTPCARRRWESSRRTRRRKIRAVPHPQLSPRSRHRLPLPLRRCDLEVCALAKYLSGICKEATDCRLQMRAVKNQGNGKWCVCRYRY